MSSYPNLFTIRALERDTVFLFDVVALLRNVTCQMISVPPDPPPHISSRGAIYTSSYTYNTFSTIYGLFSTCYKARKGALNRRDRRA
jgi:hypothetical protein